MRVVALERLRVLVRRQRASADGVEVAAVGRRAEVLARGRDVGLVGPPLAVEDLGLRDELALGLAADDDDLVAHDGGRGSGTLVVQRRQPLPRALAQHVDAVGLAGGQLGPGDEAADHDGLALVGHRREVVQGHGQAGPGRPLVGLRVEGLRRGARRLGRRCRRRPRPCRRRLSPRRTDDGRGAR